MHRRDESGQWQDTTDRVPQLGTWERDGPLKSGGGGLVSTAGDYLRFCRMLLAGGL
jgi:CubicO group peptidase (beta-lactamase class C family)